MISIVVGKPGAGKSYDTVFRLVNDLVDRLNRSAELPTIVTNLKLNIDEFSEYVRRESRKDVDLSIEFLSEEDLSEPFWWRNLPEDSRIILDESQFYWSSHKISQEEQQNLIETLSTHRHRRQDFILLTQSLTSLSVDIRKYAEVVIEVLNVKSLTLPFPISIPLRDIQVLAAAFGSRRQVYRTREGLLEGTYRVSWEGELKIQHTSPKIYALYRSTDSKKQGDNALPFADGPGMWKRGLKWFLFKHGFHLLLKLTIVLVPIFMVYFKFFARSSPVLTDSESLPVKSVDIDGFSDDTINSPFGGKVPSIVGQGWSLSPNGKIVDSPSANPRGGL